MNVFSKLKVGSVELPNRLIMAPFKTALGNRSGEANDKNLAFYRRRAQGGIGSIIFEPFYIDLRGREHPKQIGLPADSYIDGVKRMVDVVHEFDTIAIAHLNHAGRAANPKASGMPPEGPSAIQCEMSGLTPEAMSLERIEQIISQFGESARRAKEAGFDMIEIQFGLGYLIAQFMSPHTNHRKDKYKCNRDNGCRFGKDVLNAVQKQVGDDFPIIARISATEIIEDGLNLHDAFELAGFLESNGVNALHVVSGSVCESGPWYYQHMRLPLGKNLKWAAEIKKKVSIPVIVAGRMGTPEVIRQALGEELVDAVALGRPLLTDPDFALKMKSDQDSDIIPCGACLQGCLARVKLGEPVGCIVNPEAGREHEEVSEPEKSKKVVVIGGGPAGIQAALTASGRGHHVVLFEKRKLGGMIHLAYLPPGKQMMERPILGLIKKIKNSTVELRVPRKATVDIIAEEKPDVIIMAAGAAPIVPAIPGLGQAFTAEDILTGKVTPEKRVLVIGGGLAGIEVAEFMASKKHKVTIVEMMDSVARDMEPITKRLSLKMLDAMGVKIYTNTTLSWFDEKKAYVIDRGGELLLGEFDTVVAAVGLRTLDDMDQVLRDRGFEVIVIGDAKKPRQIYDAVKDGYEAGLRI